MAVANGIAAAVCSLQEGFLSYCQGAKATVHTLAFAPDGAILAGGDAYGYISLWDPADGTHLAIFSAHTSVVRELVFSPSDGLLISGGEDGAVRLWRVP